MRASPVGRRASGAEVTGVKRAFPFKRCLKSPSDTVYVGLVGGADLASIAVRRAQGFLRFDRRPSYFSHAFLFDGRGNDILECRVVDADPAKPENNGVSQGSASAYGDTRRFPNIAVIGYRFRKRPELVKEILTVARNPKAVLERFDLWDMVAAWQPYLFDPERTPNPLLTHPHPGVAFVRWALEAGGIESSPGATDQFDAPEHLWAAALWWRESYAKSPVAVEVELYRHIADKECGTPVAG